METWRSRRCGYNSRWLNLFWITQTKSLVILFRSNPKKVWQSKNTDFLWEYCLFALKLTETYFTPPGPSSMCGEKYATLPISGQCGPMKLMSLEEAQARSLSPNHPVHRERQRENSLPDTSTATLFHTVIDISDSKYDRFKSNLHDDLCFYYSQNSSRLKCLCLTVRRKLSGKSKKWKSIFNLGRSVDSKGKLSRNGSVFIRAQGITGTGTIMWKDKVIEHGQT